MNNCLAHARFPTTLFVVMVLAASPLTAFAESPHHHGSSAHGHSGSHSQSHAPIGVMGDHLHEKGEWMFSYRYMYMDMEGNRDGDSSIAPETIATTVPNTFFGATGQPPTLRVVPTKMTMEMHMLGAMYAPTDNVTLMLMTNYIAKDMDHIAFMGMAGTTQLGSFTTKTDGIGDTSLSALVRLQKNVHATIGLSIPTGSIDESDDILTPMNTRPTVTLPYPMQLGSGTYDAILGVTLSEQKGLWNYGAQFKTVLRIGENDENYSLGNEIHATSWMSYALNDALSLSSRVAYLSRGNIDGQDMRIMAPVQTADPDRHGVDRLDLNVGLNWLLPGESNRLAFEIGQPIYQKLDGPQLETDLQVTLGWQFTL